jgi:hypothetical protein
MAEKKARKVAKKRIRPKRIVPVKPKEPKESELAIQNTLRLRRWDALKILCGWTFVIMQRTRCRVVNDSIIPLKDQQGAHLFDVPPRWFEAIDLFLRRKSR